MPDGFLARGVGRCRCIALPTPKEIAQNKSRNFGELGIELSRCYMAVELDGGLGRSATIPTWRADYFDNPRDNVLWTQHAIAIPRRVRNVGKRPHRTWRPKDQ